MKFVISLSLLLLAYVHAQTPVMISDSMCMVYSHTGLMAAADDISYSTGAYQKRLNPFALSDINYLEEAIIDLTKSALAHKGWRAFYLLIIECTNVIPTIFNEVRQHWDLCDESNADKEPPAILNNQSFIDGLPDRYFNMMMSGTK